MGGEIWTTALFVGDDPLTDQFKLPSDPEFALLNDRGIQWSGTPTHTIADPFVIVGPDDRPYLFAEVCRHGQPGTIQCWRLDENGLEPLPDPVGLDPGHTSFPFVFRDGQAYYMVPESGSRHGRSNPGVYLYRFSSFPHRLEKIATLLEGEYFDSFIIREDGHFYLFTSTPYQAELWVSEQLEGPYQPHPKSPIATDRRHLRNGGAALPPSKHRPFWLRPVQDGSTGYGADLGFMRIDQLTPEEYRESPWRIGLVAGRYPWASRGAHHFSQCSWGERTVTAMDGRQRNSLLNRIIACCLRWQR